MQIIYITEQLLSLDDKDIQVTSDFNYVTTFFAQHPIIQLDTETTSLIHTDPVLLIQFGSEVSDIQLVINFQEYQKEVIATLKQYEKSLYVVHNFQFDGKFMFYFGVNLYNIWDTCVAEKCIKNGIKFDEDGQVTSAGLQYVANKYLGIYLSKEERGNIRFSGVNNPEVLKYAARDVWKLESIMYAQQKEIASKGIGKWVQLEMKFTPVLTRMVANGIYLNWDKWVEKVKKREKSLELALETLNTTANTTPQLEKFKPIQYDLFRPIKLEILWTSSQQVIPIMKALGVDTQVKDKKTGKLKDSVEAKTLEKYKSLHPLIAQYTEYKELEKEISTYGYSWIHHINKTTGRIHTTFNQIVDTTRLSSGDSKGGKKGFPNLQNLSSDKETRGCFTSQQYNTWINSCDYSSQESVYAAEATQDPTLLAIVNDGLDMHSITATAISKILTGVHQEVTKDNGIKDKKGVKLRDTAKTVNFGIQYLVQANTLSQNLQCSREEAQKIIDATVIQFQGRHDFYEKVFLESIKNGFIYINKQIKSKYYLEDWKFLKYVITTYKGYYAKQKFYFQEEVPYQDLKRFESAISVIKRSCANFPIQGTSSHITKLAMIYFDTWLTEENLHDKCKIINTAHDEILTESTDDVKDLCSTKLLECMARAGDAFCKTVKMRAEPNLTKYWAK